MRWAILAVLLVLEASALLLVVQFLARWLWIWIRWLVWLLLVIASLVAADAAITKLNGRPVVTIGDWDAARELVRLDAPYPTLRLYVLSLVGAAPILLFSLGLLSLLRWKQGGLKVLAWPIGWQSSLTGLAISFGLLLVLLFENDNSVWRKIQEMEQESRTLAQSVAPPPCTDEENAAPLFVELGAAEEISQTKLPDPTDDIERLRSDAWTKYLSRNRQRAEKIREAAARPRCRFDIEWSTADSLAEMPEIERARACIRLLYWEARRALLDGDHEKGLANAVALRRMAESLSEDPRMMAQLVATVAEQVAGNVLEHLLFVHKPTQEDLSQLVKTGFEFHKRLPAYCGRQQAEHYDFFVKLYSGRTGVASNHPLFQVPLVSSALHAQTRLLYAVDDYRALPRTFDEFRRRASVPYSEEIPDSRQSLWSFTQRLGG